MTQPTYLTQIVNKYHNELNRFLNRLYKAGKDAEVKVVESFLFRSKSNFEMKRNELKDIVIEDPTTFIGFWPPNADASSWKEETPTEGIYLETDEHDNYCIWTAARDYQGEFLLKDGDYTRLEGLPLCYQAACNALYQLHIWRPAEFVEYMANIGWSQVKPEYDISLDTYWKYADGSDPPSVILAKDDFLSHPNAQLLARYEFYTFLLHVQKGFGGLQGEWIGKLARDTPKDLVASTDRLISSLDRTLNHAEEIWAKYYPFPKLVVLAGDKRQAKYHLQQVHPSLWVYYKHPSDLAGLKDFEYIVIGTFHKKEGWPAILQNVKERQALSRTQEPADEKDSRTDGPTELPQQSEIG